MSRIKICFIILALIFLICSCVNEAGDNIVQKGLSQFEKGNYLDAIALLNEAIEVGTKEYSLEQIYITLGRCYVELDMYDEGIVELKKAIEIDDKNYIAWFNIGIAYLSNEKIDLAEDALLVAKKLNPSHADTYSLLGALYLNKKNDIEKSIKEFEMAIEINPNLVKVYGFLAIAYAMNGDFDKADEYLLQSKLLGYKNYEMIKEKIDLLR